MPGFASRYGRSADVPTAEEIAAAVHARERTAVGVVTAALERIARVDPVLCAFVEVWDEDAVRQARVVDARVAAGERLPLAGVPIGVKGRYGLRAAGALVDAGCVPVGATAVPGPGTAWQTWGVGRYGRTVNPWRADRTPGGSSAGSAAAVAAGLVPLATGSDGAGSVRIPAAWCGVVGLKSTNGRLPSGDRTGLAAPGVLARCASDVAMYWRVMAGEAPAGSTTVPTAVWSPDLGFAAPDPEPVALARAAAHRLADTGALRLVRPDPPLRLDDPAPAWLALRSSPGTDPRVAQRIRAVNDQRLADLFHGTDLLLTPTTPNPPHSHDGPGERYSTALTWAFNLSGHPAISIPAGIGADGCPLGLQIVAAHGREDLLITLAQAAAMTNSRTPERNEPPCAGPSTESAPSTTPPGYACAPWT
ncbi:amidase [Streptomyces sp. NPDC052051]|uniref:amidase n=1 Tax=Streptomyces sp. NPDC052051 TaxID=3154649 RepID=UPI0034401343